jgi:hypothetical protein
MSQSQSTSRFHLLSVSSHRDERMRFI